MQLKTMSYYDPYPTPLCNGTKYLEHVHSFFKSYESDLNIAHCCWSLITPRNIPFQDPRSNDCGIFICQYAKSILSSGLLGKDSFKHIGNSRDKMKSELLHNILYPM